MIVLDENINVEQRQLLQTWHIPVRHIGYDLGREGIKDDGIIPMFHRLRHLTFFTRDFDFYECVLCHSQYCLVYMAVKPSDVAMYARRLLRHRDFDTQAKRMGAVIRVAQPGLTVWHLHAEQEISFT